METKQESKGQAKIYAGTAMFLWIMSIVVLVGMLYSFGLSILTIIF